MSKLIAIVDDEQDILELVSLHLKKAGFETREFLSPMDFLNFVKDRNPDLLILDLMLPDTDGFDICRFLQKDEKYSSIPIIMLTAKSEETDKVLGLELGADDYITKPFSPRELVARVRAVLRRKEEKKETEKIKVGEILTIDLEKYNVAVNGKKIALTSTEFRILKQLSLKKGRVFTREQILDYLWGREKAVVDRTIDVHIKNLRDKLGKAGRFIKNLRGVGYKIEE